MNTKDVTGRRELHFNSLDEILEDARSLVKVPHRQLGNWTLGQVLKHLSIGCEIAVDGTTIRAPWYFRMMARMMKRKILNSPLKPGFKFTEDMKPIFSPAPDTTEADGLAALEFAIEKLKTSSKRSPSPAFGQLTIEEYNQLTCRHAELHLSFIVPE